MEFKTESEIARVSARNFLRKAESSVADPGCLSRILIFIHPGSQISDPGTKNSNKREG
jgi:hypothetical protein